MSDALEHEKWARLQEFATAAASCNSVHKDKRHLPKIVGFKYDFVEFLALLAAPHFAAARSI